MQQLLAFIETFCWESSPKWHVQQTGSNLEFMVTVKRTPEGFRWMVSGEQDASQFEVDSKGLPQLLESLGVNTHLFSKLVGGTVLFHTVRADLLVSAARQVFGDDAVERCLVEAHGFIGHASQAAESVKKKSAASAARRLRVVPSNDGQIND